MHLRSLEVYVTLIKDRSRTTQTGQIVNLETPFFLSVRVLRNVFFSFDKNPDKSAGKEINSLLDQGRPFTLYTHLTPCV